MPEMQDWKVRTCDLMVEARRAGSSEGGKKFGERAFELVEEEGLRAGEVSRPVVKARGEVEERIMARVVGELER